jgi:hypothetical protein
MIVSNDYLSAVTCQHVSSNVSTDTDRFTRLNWHKSGTITKKIKFGERRQIFFPYIFLEFRILFFNTSVAPQRRAPGPVPFLEAAHLGTDRVCRT